MKQVLSHSSLNAVTVAESVSSPMVRYAVDRATDDHAKVDDDCMKRLNTFKPRNCPASARHFQLACCGMEGKQLIAFLNDVAPSTKEHIDD